MLDLAGAGPCTAAGDCRTLDGRSLMPLLRGAQAGLGQGPHAAVPDRQNRTCGELPERGLRNFYDAVRTKRFVYIEHNRVNPETGACDRPEYEMYDLKRDPYELESIAVEPGDQAPSADPARGSPPTARADPTYARAAAAATPGASEPRRSRDN